MSLNFFLFFFKCVSFFIIQWKGKHLFNHSQLHYFLFYGQNILALKFIAEIDLIVNANVKKQIR